MDNRKKALMVIEGSLLADEPEDKRLCFIYRMAHAGNGECEHDAWMKEMDTAYEQLIADKILSPEPQPDQSRRLLTDEEEAFVDEITNRCYASKESGIHSEVQYTALHFKSKGKVDCQARIEALIEDLRALTKDKIVNRYLDICERHLKATCTKDGQ